MATAKSTRAPSRGRSRRIRGTSQATSSGRTAVLDCMGRLSDCISTVSTVSRAIAWAEDQEGATAPQDLGDEITALRHGVEQLRAAYTALDAAIAASR